MATILEDFEDATLNLTITGDWTRAQGNAAFGSWSLRSRTISDLESTQAVVAIPAQATSLTFYYRVSSEADFDKLHVLIDDVEVLTESGDVAWASATYNVTGKSQVTFLYTKDESFPNGSDAAWVDQIEFTVPDTGTPKAGADSGTLTETTNIAPVPEVAKASTDSGHLAEARWASEPQGGTIPPSIRSTSTAASGTATYTINKPDGLALNDIVIGIQAADRGSTAVMTDPTGGTTWQLLDSLDTNNGIIQAIRVWWKRAGSAEPGTYTFKQQGGSDGVCLLVAIKDASLTAAPKLVRSTAGTGLNITTPGITPDSNSDVELRLVAAYALGVAMTFDEPDGLTPLTRVQSRIYTVVAAAARTLESNAATSPADFVASVDEVEWRAGYTLAITPAVTGPPQAAKAASDAASLAESSAVAVLPDGEPMAADDTATLIESAAAMSDATASDMAALVEAPAVDAVPGGADQAVLGETSMLEVGWSGVDQAHVIDTAHVDVQAAGVDSGALAELADVAKTIGPITADSGTLAEAAAVAAQAMAADAGALAEMSMLEVGRQAADQAVLAETAQLGTQTAGVDSGVLAETVNVAKTIGPISADSGTLAEVATVETQLAAADAGALHEAASAAVAKEASDAATLAEQVSIGLAASDAATLAELAAVDAAIAGSDSGTLTDHASLVVPKFATDAAVLAEHAEVLNIGRAIGAVGLIRRGWAARTPRRRWAAGKPRRAWRADSPHT
ncbi:hypothetical protein B0I32_106254 [Nonomuraea fuscirosea]|uniref:Uncharacterized protein n=1 Tax=Nonomuraea fuscirosea TaxID=1291556 RepID=A0A2T0N2A3_9ACTN|nr:hypothetical protein [Nonomuraea fuscirosea]PRX66118.1 hypothetical protein B0I32_106254 [Nonomuraea fuscirosea]